MAMKTLEALRTFERTKGLGFGLSSLCQAMFEFPFKRVKSQLPHVYSWDKPITEEQARHFRRDASIVVVCFWVFTEI